MKEQLSHILEQSVCLSRKQMKEYLSGSMLPEEVHAAELHISSCPLCSMAMEGFEEHNEDALAAIASLNSGFLKEHFDNIAPQIHLNSMAPAASLSNSARSATASNTWIRPASIAAGLLLVCLGAWYLASRERRISETTHEFATSNGPVTSVPTAAEGGLRSDVTPMQNAAPGAATVPASKSASTTATSSGSAEKHADANHRAEEHKNTSTQKKSSDASLGAAYYWQPEPNAGDDPTQPAKTPQTILPSANDPAKTYSGQISSRTSKMYVPESSESAATTSGNAAAPAMNRAAMNKPALAPPVATTEPTATKATAKRTDENPDQLYERGEYRSALTRYRQQIRSSDPEVRSHASLQAARCHAALGEADRAEELLRKVVENGNGRDRRTARKLLRNLR